MESKHGCTIGNRVLIHLSGYSRFRDEYVCPQDMTQDGIASRLGISRAHVALELKRLRQKDQVEYRLAHVAMAKSRRKVYSLTRAGNDAAEDLKNKARSKKVRILDGNGGMEHSGHEVLKVLASAGVPESDALIKILTTEAIPVTDGHRNGAADAPSLIGREQEIARLDRWLRSPGKAVCVLIGADGVGKSSLGTLLMSRFTGNSVLCSVGPLQSVRSILAGIAGSLAESGRTRLKAVLSSEEFEPREALLALAEEMAGGLLVLDDVHNSPDVEDFAKLFLTMNDWPLKVLLTSRRKPAFCQRWSDTFQKPYEDMPLTGLGLEGARLLMVTRVKSATEEGMAAAYAATQGRPLDLVTLAGLGWGFDSTRVPSVGELLCSLTTEEESKSLKLAAVSRMPIESRCQGITSRLRSLFQEEEGHLVLNESLRSVQMERMGDEERRSLHAEAGRSEDLAGNSVAAAAHYVKAGLRDMAVSALLKVDANGARERAMELHAIIKMIGDDTRLDTVRSMTLENIGRLEEARASYERVVSMAKTPSAETLLMLAGIEVKMSLLADAEGHYAMAATAAVREGDHVRQARAVQGSADVHRLRGDLDRAAKGCTEARDILERAGEWREAVRCGVALGELELSRGNAAGAVAELTAALQSEGSRGPDSTRALNDLGLACRGIGDEERALELFMEAAKTAETFGQARIAASSLANAAESRLRQGRKEESEELCMKALRIGERLGDAALLAGVHATLGRLNKELALWSRAESHILTSIELTKTMNSPQTLASRYMELAELYELKGEARKAKLWSKRAIRKLEWDGAEKASDGEKSAVNTS